MLTAPVFAEQPARNEKTADLAELITLAEKTRGDEGCQLLGQVIRILSDRKVQADAELTRRFSACLEKIARTPQDVAQVLSPVARKSVMRQAQYRRYQEQWIYHHPVSLIVLIEHRLGEGRRLQNVRAVSKQK